MREDESDSRFPIKRMPMGLVEYAADFFVADNLQSVGMVPFNYNFIFTRVETRGATRNL